MASRLLFRRISGKHLQHASPSIPTSGGFSTLFQVLINQRQIHTKLPSIDTAEEKSEEPDAAAAPTSNSMQVTGPTNKGSSVTYSALSNLKSSNRHDLAMVFTCKVCETRSVKTACRESYEKGIVVAHCSGCNNLHLIADRLGWFGEPGSVEDLLAARGEEVKKGSVDTLNLTLEDLAGTRS